MSRPSSTLAQVVAIAVAVVALEAWAISGSLAIGSRIRHGGDHVPSRSDTTVTRRRVGVAVASGVLGVAGLAYLAANIHTYTTHLLHRGGLVTVGCATQVTALLNGVVYTMGPCSSGQFQSIYVENVGSVTQSSSLWGTLTLAAAAAAAAALVATALLLLKARRIRLEASGGAGDLIPSSETTTVLGRRAWSVVGVAAVLLGLPVLAVEFAIGASYGAVVAAIAGVAACLVGFGVLGRYLRLRP